MFMPSTRLLIVNAARRATDVSKVTCRIPVMTDHKDITINESCGILLYILKMFGAWLLLGHVVAQQWR
jgi:glutathione S-transferase